MNMTWKPVALSRRAINNIATYARIYWARGKKHTKTGLQQTLFSVIPARVGIQNGLYEARSVCNVQTWIPAFAGMTVAVYAHATATGTSGFFNLEAIVQTPDSLAHLIVQAGSL